MSGKALLRVSSTSNVTRLLVLLNAPNTTRVCVSRECATSPSQDPIIIPKRIHRSNTDVLKALAGTVARDLTGPHYKYQDDPYLTPHSNIAKRNYALSKESGRKAARWIRESNAKLFTHTPDDPMIQSFHPNIEYTEDGSGRSKMADVDQLESAIQRGSVKDAMLIYDLCGKKELDISQGTLQQFLELLCLHNAEEGDQEESEWVEAKWHKQTNAPIKNTWKDGGLAEEVFALLKHTGSPAYCALIRGMANYYQVDGAWKRYQECVEAGIPLDTVTYNAIITIAPLLKEDAELRWQLVKEILQAMCESGCRPNLGTLNATLEALTHCPGWRETKDITLQVMAEFHSLGVEPSLASYYHLLTIHCKQREGGGARSGILLDILDRLESHHQGLLPPRDANDLNFFVTAMEVARYQLRSLEAARRVESLRQHGDNHLLIGDSYKESVYFRHFLSISCSSLPMEEFMEVYNELVPHMYIPELRIMEEVLQAVGVSGVLHFLPQLWTDIVNFDHCSRDNIVEETISALLQHHPDPEDPVLTERLGRIAKDIWERVQGQDPNRRIKVTWTGEMVGGVLEVLTRCGEYSTAQDVLREATTNPHKIAGVLPQNALNAMLNAAIDRQDADTAVATILYAQEAGHMETGQMAITLRSSMALSPQNKAKLASSLGGELSFSLDTPQDSGV